MKPTRVFLEELMSYYTVDNLRIDRGRFKKELNSFLNLKNYEVEGLKTQDRQRTYTVEFHWGHDHDFGDFKLKGRMGNRHIELLETFIDVFNLPRDLTGFKVLDVGCWTGGTSLLLCRMGAEVIAIDEVHKYIQALNFLKDAFGIDNLTALPLSLYELDEGYYDTFDYILFCGVIYHLSDPVLGLRTLYNCLKKGGTLLIESEGVLTKDPVCYYEGVFKGWNWFIPSPEALKRMMYDVGYDEVKLHIPKKFKKKGILLKSKLCKYPRIRFYATGTKTNHKEITRVGLADRKID